MLTLWLFLPPPHRELLGKWDDSDLWLSFHFEPSLSFVDVVSAAFPVPNTIPARTILLEWKMFRTATLILNRKPSFQFCPEDRDHTLIDMYHPRCLTLHAQRYIYITNTHGLCFLYNKQDIFCMKLVFFPTDQYVIAFPPSECIRVTSFFWIVFTITSFLSIADGHLIVSVFFYHKQMLQ